MKTTPEDIIGAFDECLIYLYGQRYARDNPHKTDMETAKKWVDDGLKLEIACFVFFDRMNYMHEKHLRHHGKGDRSDIPGSLKLFDENIECAIRKMGGEELDEWEKVNNQWRSRFKGWQKDRKLWRPEMWGPEPFEIGCRVPSAILARVNKYEEHMQIARKRGDA